MSGDSMRLMDVRDLSFVAWVGAMVGTGALFVVQEKVCGQYVSLRCDGREVSFGQVPSGSLADRCLREWVERYQPLLFRLHAHIRQLFPDVRITEVFGELFGGAYPHRSVAGCEKRVPVRAGVYYAPDYEFYAFDIRVEDGKKRVSQRGQGRGDADGYARGGGLSSGGYLSLPVCNHLFEGLGFCYARTLFHGSLAECLRYPNSFLTHLPDWLGLPPLRNNWCAGTVIRPQVPLFTADGQRVLLKNDNSRMGKVGPAERAAGLYAVAESSATAAAANEVHEPPPLYVPSVSRECADMLSEVRDLFSPALLNRVLQKTGRAHSRKEAARVSALLRREVLEEFFKLNLNRYDALPARERQEITRSLRQLSDRMARDAL